MYNTDIPSRAELPSSAQLLRSTIIAALVAAVLLVTTILPAEYGIDPTGVGRLLGLTPMGQIKMSLKADAEAEKKSAPQAKPTILTNQQPAVKPQLEVASTPPPAPAETKGMEHTMTVTLKPGQGAEIKLGMRKGATVTYEWSVTGGTVNYDLHGDPVNAPKNFYHGYGKGRNLTGDSGALTAAFDGTHGWFWRNRSGGEVTVTLKTKGDYQTIKRVL